VAIGLSIGVAIGLSIGVAIGLSIGLSRGLNRGIDIGLKKGLSIGLYISVRSLIACVIEYICSKKDILYIQIFLNNINNFIYISFIYEYYTIRQSVFI
jgi:hypothetical protein